MHPPTELRRPAGAARPGVRAGRVPVVAGLLVAVVALFVVARLLAPPAFVDHVTMVNPTPYQLEVEVTGTDRDGWTALGTADARGRTTVDEVYDVGDDWILRFTTQGIVTREVEISRRRLERDGWRIEIPAATGRALRDAGAPLPP